MTHEIKLAWQLAELARSQMDDVERDRVYVAIGAGDAFTAIALITRTLVRASLAVRTDLIKVLLGWLDGYCYHPEEPRLRELLGKVQARPIFPDFRGLWRY